MTLKFKTVSFLIFEYVGALTIDLCIKNDHSRFNRCDRFLYYTFEYTELFKDIGLAIKDCAIDEGLHVEAVLLCDVCMSFVKLVHGVDLNREALVAPSAA